jgi:hypothetical protein
MMISYLHRVDLRDVIRHFARRRRVDGMRHNRLKILCLCHSFSPIPFKRVASGHIDVGPMKFLPLQRCMVVHSDYTCPKILGVKVR